MPISKRDRLVHTSQVKRSDKSAKNEQIDSIRNAIESSRYVYAVTISNERNNILKAIRDEIKPGRIFYSKNKLIQVALGFTPESECAEGIHKLVGHMVGHCGLIASNLSSTELKEFLKTHEEPEFARAGGVATDTVVLASGFESMSGFPHSMETQLRKLGLPTMLHDAKIQLLAEYTVCKAGDILTANQAQLLKLLNIQMAKFEITPRAVWDRETQSVTELD